MHRVFGNTQEFRISYIPRAIVGSGRVAVSFREWFRGYGVIGCFFQAGSFGGDVSDRELPGEFGVGVEDDPFVYEAELQREPGG